MKKKEIDDLYMERLEILYKLALKKKEAGTAMVLLDKIINLHRYMERPAEEPDAATV